MAVRFKLAVRNLAIFYIFPESTHPKLHFGGSFMLVAPVVAAVEFFENGASPDFGDSGGACAPRKPSFWGWWGVGGAWVGVSNHRSGGA